MQLQEQFQHWYELPEFHIYFAYCDTINLYQLCMLFNNNGNENPHRYGVISVVHWCVQISCHLCAMYRNTYMYLIVPQLHLNQDPVIMLWCEMKIKIVYFYHIYALNNSTFGLEKTKLLKKLWIDGDVTLATITGTIARVPGILANWVQVAAKFHLPAQIFVVVTAARQHVPLCTQYRWTSAGWAHILTYINLNSNIDKKLHTSQSVGWNYSSIPKLQRLHRWSLWMDK